MKKEKSLYFYFMMQLYFICTLSLYPISGPDCQEHYHYSKLCHPESRMKLIEFAGEHRCLYGKCLLPQLQGFTSIISHQSYIEANLKKLNKSIVFMATFSRLFWEKLQIRVVYNFLYLWYCPSFEGNTFIPKHNMTQELWTIREQILSDKFSCCKYHTNMKSKQHINTSKSIWVL